LLSAFLVINTISALMAQQVRYIGVMKAVGARTVQILGMYVVLLLCLGAMAFVIAAPLGLYLGYFAASMIAHGLNFAITPLAVEPTPLALMAVLSLLVPVVAGLVPVRNGAVTTIRAAISGYGLGAGYGKGLIDRFFGALHGLSRPLAISLRNTVRRKVRLVLTLATLVLAGSIFMGVMSTQGSMNGSLARMYRYYLADVNIDFDRPYRIQEIDGLLGDIPGVAKVEGWIFSSGEVLPPPGSSEDGQRVATDRLTVVAPPTDSLMVERSVSSGRWLLPDDDNALVMCTTAMRAHPDWQLGSTIHLRLDGNMESDFVIVGTFPFASGEGNKMAMASSPYLADLLNQRAQAVSFRIVTSPHAAATQDGVRDTAIARIKAMGYKATVASGHTTADALGAILNIIVQFLLGLALLIGLVGGLGLMGMMGMNVLERTREIGVMRSIGAGNGIIMQLVIVEGLLTGLLSWAGGALLGIPIGKLLSTVLGQGLFGVPFDFVWNAYGLLVWLVIVVVLSVVASALPAWNASRLTVREVLAYE
jgi:putative ABC transport system permease protein